MTDLVQVVQVLPVVLDVLVPVCARHHELAVEFHQVLHQLLVSARKHREALLQNTGQSRACRQSVTERIGAREHTIAHSGLSE